MNNMKHYLFMVIAALALTFTACGSKESKQNSLFYTIPKQEQQKL